MFVLLRMVERKVESEVYWSLVVAELVGEATLLVMVDVEVIVTITAVVRVGRTARRGRGSSERSIARVGEQQMWHSEELEVALKMRCGNTDMFRRRVTQDLAREDQQQQLQRKDAEDMVTRGMLSITCFL